MWILSKGTMSPPQQPPEVSRKVFGRVPEGDIETSVLYAYACDVVSDNMVL